VWLWEEEINGERSGDDFNLVSDLRQLRNWFYEAATEFNQNIVWGYGRTWTRFSEKAFPFLLISRPTRFTGFLSDHQSPVPIEILLPSSERKELRLPETKYPLFALAVGQPQPSATIAERLEQILPIQKGIYCPETRTQGTAGIQVETLDGFPGILTAGHVFPEGNGSRVESFNGWKIWRRPEKFGYVMHCSVPLNETGWDVAVIFQTSRVQAPLRKCSLFRGERHGQELVYAKGAQSGVVDEAILIAGLEEIRPAPLGWRCCWLIGPTDVLRAGDSGASVFVRNSGALLGTYVGCSLMGGSKPYALYVQDARSLQSNILSNWGIFIP
jgi:hypothetical protein